MSQEEREKKRRGGKREGRKRVLRRLPSICRPGSRASSISIISWEKRKEAGASRLAARHHSPGRGKRKRGRRGPPAMNCCLQFLEEKRGRRCRQRGDSAQLRRLHGASSEKERKGNGSASRISPTPPPLSSPITKREEKKGKKA